MPTPSHTLNEARTINTVRERLRAVLRTGDAYNVREEVINLLAELGSGTVFTADEVDECAPTVRDTEPDSAPPVPLERPSGGA